MIMLGRLSWASSQTNSTPVNMFHKDPLTEARRFCCAAALQNWCHEQPRPWSCRSVAKKSERCVDGQSCSNGTDLDMLVLERGQSSISVEVIFWMTSCILPLHFIQILSHVSSGGLSNEWVGWNPNPTLVEFFSFNCGVLWFVFIFQFGGIWHKHKHHTY